MRTTRPTPTLMTNSLVEDTRALGCANPGVPTEIPIELVALYGHLNPKRGWLRSRFPARNLTRATTQWNQINHLRLDLAAVACQPRAKGRRGPIASIFVNAAQMSLRWLRIPRRTECPADASIPDRCTMKQASAAHKKAPRSCCAC